MFRGEYVCTCVYVWVCVYVYGWMGVYGVCIYSVCGCVNECVRMNLYVFVYGCICVACVYEHVCMGVCVWCVYL